MNFDPQQAETFLKDLRDDIAKRQVSNSENFDKSVLSLSTAFLGFSMAFLKDAVPYNDANLKFLLPISWVLFGTSIIETMASYFISQSGLNKQLEIATQYYRSGDDTVLDTPNRAAKWTTRINLSSAVTFILAVISTIVFFASNLSQGGNMSGRQIKKAQDVPQIQKLPPQQKPEVSVEVPAIPRLPKTPSSGGEAGTKKPSK